MSTESRVKGSINGELVKSRVSEDTIKVFKRYDIRGVYPSEINENLSLRLGRAFGAFVKEGSDSLVIGTDNKESSLSLKHAFISGVLSVGVNVIDIGMGPTDMVALAGVEFKRPGVMVTSSHLNLENNGFKFIYPQGNGFLNEDLNEVKRKYLEKSYRLVSRKDLGKVYCTNFVSQYLEKVEDAFHFFSGSLSRKGKVIVDTGDGATSQVLPAILEQEGAEVIRINSSINGGFRRHPNPTEKNIAYLKKMIKKHKAYIALASDMDGDRLSVLDSKGRWVDGNLLFANFIDKMVRKGENVVASLDASQLIEKLCEVKGINLIYTKIGDPFVIGEALKRRAKLAGEPNGHYCTPKLVHYNSGTFFGLIVAAFPEFESESGFRSNFGVADWNYSVETGYKRVGNKDKDGLMEGLKNKIKGSEEYEVISELDGILFRTEGARVLIRASGTSSKIRVMVECPNSTESKDRCKSILKKMLSMV